MRPSRHPPCLRAADLLAGVKHKELGGWRRHSVRAASVKAAVIRFTKLGCLKQVRVKRDQPHWLTDEEGTRIGRPNSKGARASRPDRKERLMRLTFLAPDIVRGILIGCRPPELTARRLMADTRVPLAWDEQRALLGFV